MHQHIGRRLAKLITEQANLLFVVGTPRIKTGAIGKMIANGLHGVPVSSRDHQKTIDIEITQPATP